MTITELHYAFKIAMDRVDTLSNQDFNSAEIDWLLNEAQYLFLKKRTGVNNAYKRGFENSQKRIDDLSTLVIKYPVQPAITPVDDEVSLSALNYPYYQLISAKADVEIAEDCVKSIPLRFIQHDDYFAVNRDPFNNASLEFIPYNFGASSSGTGTSIYLYPGTYTVNSVYIDYIKYPSKVSLGNYTYIDGAIHAASTFEFPEHTHQEIVNLAAEIAAGNILSPEYLNLKAQRAFNSE